MTNTVVRTSKFLSLILRHNPAKAGITLDENGWADVGQLLEAVNASGHVLTLDLLHQIVSDNSKQRFKFNADGTRIRANQGHSIEIDLGLEPQIPPTVLLHGTASRFLDSIRQSGLEPQSRQHVHLSIDRKTAISVGQRHGIAVVLQVDSEGMAAASFGFYLSDNGVWLTERVPPEYITFP